jgi:hypothetical protein
MNLSIVFDGRVRLDEVLREKRALRRAQLWREVGLRFEAESRSVGFWERVLIRWRIRKEVASMMENEFPSAQALFVR